MCSSKKHKLITANVKLMRELLKFFSKTYMSSDGF